MDNYHAPANGERNAMIGYTPQYLVAADLIYSAIVDGTLEWIRITDPEVGRVDDIVIGRQGRIDAYQVKWGEQTKNISFKDLIKPTKIDKKTKPSLINQLADGWKRLKEIYTDKQVYVHLISKDVPSVHAKIPLDVDKPKKANFQGFIIDCYKDKAWLQNKLKSIPKGWSKATKTLQSTTGLNDNDFIDFWKNSFLEFQYQLPNIETISIRSEARRIKDVRELFRVLFELAGAEKRIIEINQQDLLKRLSWESRFKFYFKHEFWVDEKIYQPIDETIEELESALQQNKNGYLALVGTPGSGKSTTLTQTLRYRKGYRVVRYYAFVRDDRRLGRGEALNFLHDLVFALRQQGIIGNVRNIPSTKDELLDELSAQLIDLGKRWSEDGIKTLILIDGLDHIEREQSPERSLLKELPLPSSVPDGVLFILGSQKIDLIDISAAIKAQLSEKDRTITIRSLKKRAVVKIVDALQTTHTFNYRQKDLIYKLSDGHPLALIYLLQKICSAVDSEAVDEILNSTDPYKQNIEVEYKTHWLSLETDTDIRNLLGLICRLRGAINLHDTISWVGEDIVRLFIKKASHYFRQESETRWHFFHNSFRQFLLTKTGRNVFGTADQAKHSLYHEQLADYASTSTTDNSWSWEEIYHRACAGDNGTVIKLSTQDRFRKQFYKLRPLEDIEDDMTLCLEAAREKFDGLAVIRCFLIEAELNLRDEKIGESDLPRLLFELGDVNAAINCILNGSELRVSNLEALRFCNFLITKDEFGSAKVVFDAADPIDILSGSTGVCLSFHENIKDVKAWANVAHYFLPLEKILSTINQLTADTTHNIHETSPEILEKNIRYSVLKSLAKSIFNCGDNIKLLALKDILIKHEDGKDILLNLDFMSCAERTISEETLGALDRLLLWECENEISDEDKILLAEFVCRIKDDQSLAVKLIENIDQPKQYNKHDVTGRECSNLKVFLTRIRLNRLLSTFGMAVPPSIAVKAVDDNHYYGDVIFERAIVLLANLWGRAWRGDELTESEITKEIYPALILFNKPWQDTRDWFHWHQYERAATDYFDFLIKAVASHGKAAVLALETEFEKQWDGEQTRKFWRRHWRRHIVLVLYENGCSLEKLIDKLSSIESEMGVWDELEERIEECSDQAFAWIKAGEKERAKALIPKLFETSFGILYDKDSQFYNWVCWLAKIIELKNEDVKVDINKFTAALGVIKYASRGSMIQEASVKLTEAVAAWNPGYAIDWLGWLLEEGAIHYTSSIEGVLTASLKQEKPQIEIINIAVEHLLIPFQHNCSQELATLFAKRCYQSVGSSHASEILETLSKAIRIKAYPSDRNDWWKSLIDGLKEVSAGTNWLEKMLPEKPKKEKRGDYFEVSLKNGEKLSAEEVCRRIYTYKELLEFLNSIEEVKYLRWEKIISQLVDDLSIEQIRTISTQLDKYKPNEITKSLFAKRLNDLGEKDEAKKILLEAIESSPPSGWNKYYDGGTRLEAAKRLIGIASDECRTTVFELLITDYISQVRAPSQFISRLEDFLPILFEEPENEKIWSELKSHIYQLNEFIQAEKVPPLATETMFAKSDADLLINTFFSYVTFPVPAVKQEAHKAIFKVIVNQLADFEAEKELIKLLNSNEANHQAALAILEAVITHRKDFVRGFEAEIIQLTVSPNFIVRQIALKLACLLEFEPMQIEQSRSNLSPIYKLELPELVMPEWKVPFDSIPAGEVFPDTDDPVELIKPFLPSLALLSEITSIPLQNILYRATMLMKELSPVNEWDKQAENKVRDWLNQIDVKLSYNRPRAVLAFRAFGYVTAELIDAGMIGNDGALSLVKKYTVVHDPVLSVIEPSLRPVEIILSEYDVMGASSRKEWINVEETHLELLLSQMNDGRLVLGEISRIVNLQWKKPTEYRFSMICHPDYDLPDKISDAFDFFKSKTHWHSFDYGEMGQLHSMPSLVVHVTPLQVKLGTKEWLAIHPSIPLHLGWSLSKEGHFRWVNSESEIMVESIMWQDGPIHREPPRSEETCSEGWFVVATNEAFKLLTGLCTPAVRKCAIVRHMRDENKVKHNSLLGNMSLEIKK